MIGPGLSTTRPPVRPPRRLLGARRWARLAAISVALVLAFTALGAIPDAHAAAPRRLGVVKFHGPAEGASRVAVMRAAKANHFIVIGDRQIEKTARRLKVRLDSNSSFEAVARALGITAFVTGEVARRKATLTVRGGAGGAVGGEASWTAPDPRRLAAAVGRTFWKRLGPAIEKAASPKGAKLDEAAEEETVAEDTDDASAGDEAGATGRRAEPAASGPAAATARTRQSPRARAGTNAPSGEQAPVRVSEEGEGEGEGEREGPGSDRAASKRARQAAAEGRVEPQVEALSLAFGPRFGTRSLSYVDDRYGMNSNYSLSKAPSVGIDVDFFPAALSSRGVLADIGVTGSFSYLLPVVKSKFPDSDTTYTTHGLTWSLGLKVRLPVGLYLTAAVGSRFFEVVDDPTAPTDVPTISYQFVRGGGGLRSRLSRTVFVMGHGAYLRCLKLGAIGDAGYYPDATAAGFEAGAAVGFVVSPHIELRAGVDVQRFGLDFHVKLADFMNGARTAGGAIDQYSEAWVAMAFVIGSPPTGANTSTTTSTTTGTTSTSVR